MENETKKSEDNLKMAFDYIRTFYREAAQLLTDIIDGMEENGWEPEKEYITDDLSYSIDKPEKWLYYYVYKNFHNDNQPNYFKGVLIFFDEVKSEFPPSIVCGNVYVQKEFYHKDFLYWFWYENKEKLAKRDGEIIEMYTNYQNNKIKGKLFCYPLASIKNKQKLEELIVEKLISLG